MDEETRTRLLREQEAAIAFNRGLHTAVHVLEAAENLSWRGRRHLLEKLKEDIRNSELAYTGLLVRSVLGQDRRASGAVSPEIPDPFASPGGA